MLASLWNLAVRELDGARGGFLLAGSLIRDDLPAYLKNALEDPDRLLVIGLIDEVSVGIASVICDRSRRDTVGALELIFVEPPARQVGVAEAMVDVALRWCSTRGCVGVDAPALPGNRPAKAFFEDHGFLARLLVMHRPLPDSGRS
ncbi:MAG TPA: GNAT family N-acetyltransferase [Acidimicrobiales bacterium]|nr:GNAT family N-acetyltransferase [Acidimicrobiales bacterium]